jgi:hypothetical protein
MPSPISMKSSVITLKPEVEWLEEEIVLSVERLIEVNAKCRHLNNPPVKLLCGRCLSEFIEWR